MGVWRSVPHRYWRKVKGLRGSEGEVVDYRWGRTRLWFVEWRWNRPRLWIIFEAKYLPKIRLEQDESRHRSEEGKKEA